MGARARLVADGLEDGLEAALVGGGVREGEHIAFDDASAEGHLDADAGAHPVGEVLGNRVVERPVNGVLGGDLGDHVGVGGMKKGAGRPAPRLGAACSGDESPRRAG